MRIFYDVDTQKDFMNKDGALYVPGAETIKGNLKKLTDYALENEIQILGSMDRHFIDDVELKEFPLHCMDGTDGQTRIPETLVSDNEIVLSDKIKQFGWFTKYTYGDLIDLIKSGKKRITFEKQYTDVFINPHAGFIFEKLGVTGAVVYGVATEYCVKDVVLGLLKRGIEVVVVLDAIKGISDDEKALDEMDEKGAEFVTVAEVIEEM